MPEYPESEKLLAHKDEGSLIAEFIDWLEGEKEMYICEIPQLPDDEVDPEAREYFRNYQPVHLNRYNGLLYEFFGVDIEKVEAEREQMLEDIRKANDAKG